ncbi:MAG: nitroreductase family protein [Lachnospiraceae bacterium]
MNTNDVRLFILGIYNEKREKGKDMAKNENAIYTRRSIRKFQEKELPREKIEEIIRAGIAAPSAKNRQPWKCIVFGGKEKKDILSRI